MGPALLEQLPPDGSGGHFAPVRVNDQLTLDFMTVGATGAAEGTEGHHLAFDVDPETFDAILGRLHTLGVPYGNDPSAPDNGRVDHPLCARGLYFADETGNLYEVMSPR
ncbi:VOC family protein [Streptomyces regalis]|uniref:VOC family protein n=1 Tax=Streptomyces regalis TaxID=68262 RepID=UPI001FC936DA|nr:VOC family protein [Streptomyces regalis]